jgi:hypothetical protein
VLPRGSGIAATPTRGTPNDGTWTLCTTAPLPSGDPPPRLLASAATAPLLPDGTPNEGVAPNGGGAAKAGVVPKAGGAPKTGVVPKAGGAPKAGVVPKACGPPNGGKMGSGMFWNCWVPVMRGAAAAVTLLPGACIMFPRQCTLMWGSCYRPATKPSTWQCSGHVGSACAVRAPFTRAHPATMDASGRRGMGVKAGSQPASQRYSAGRGGFPALSPRAARPNPHCLEYSVTPRRACWPGDKPTPDRSTQIRLRRICVPPAVYSWISQNHGCTLRRHFQQRVRSRVLS